MQACEERQSNVDLLRIITAMGVVILHYNHVDAGGGLKYVSEGSINAILLLFLECAFVGAVNLFVLMSGFLMCKNNKRNLIKPLALILQVVIFNLLFYVRKLNVGMIEFSFKGFVLALLPVNYFVILYIVVYFISPYINILMQKISIKTNRRLIICIIVAFSLWPTIVDVMEHIVNGQFLGLSSIGMYGSQKGYTIVNFIMMYMIGALIRLCEEKDIFSRISIFKLVVLLFGVLISIYLWSMWDRSTAWEYCNPLIIFEAIIVFLLFRKIKIKSNKVINHLAKAAFTCFLAHNLFLPLIDVEKYVTENWAVMICHIVCSVCIIYVFSYILYMIYQLLTRPIFNILKRYIKDYEVTLED